MNLYIVYLQNDKETLLFVVADSEEDCRNKMCDKTSTNFRIRGVIGTHTDIDIWPLDSIFTVDMNQIPLIP